MNQAVGFANESAGCALALLVMTRLGCRVTLAYSILQGQLFALPLPLPFPPPFALPLPFPLPLPLPLPMPLNFLRFCPASLRHGTTELTTLQCWKFVLCSPSALPATRSCMAICAVSKGAVTFTTLLLSEDYTIGLLLSGIQLSLLHTPFTGQGPKGPC